MLVGPSIRQIEMFVGLANAGNFSDAAERLGISQSGLSQAIAQIEFILDIKLFDRSTRRVKLTRAGEQFLSRAERVLIEYETALRDINQLADPYIGRVSIASLSSIAATTMPKVIASFRKDAPAVTLSVVDDNSLGVIERLRTGEVDMAIGSLMEPEPGIEYTPILREQYVVACRQDHSFSKRKRVTWEDLKAEPFIGFSPGAGTTLQLRHALAGRATLPRPQYEAVLLSTILGLIEGGVGVSVLPFLSVTTQHKNLRAVRIVSPAIDRTLGILVRAKTSLPPEARLFRSYLVRHLEQLPDDSSFITLHG